MNESGKDTKMVRSDLAGVVRAWGMDLVKVREDLLLSGSPERSAFRASIEDARGDLFVVEQIEALDAERKRVIAETMSALKNADGHLPIHPYLRDIQGSFITERDGTYWQVMPYIEGVPLDRRTYLNDGWRGKVMAAFLIRMRDASKAFPEQGKVFSIKNYVLDMMGKMERYGYAEHKFAREIVLKLDGLFKVYDDLPVSFCHGDYHPLNIIWGDGEIRSVIDWEFCGRKAELYDIANMTGCLGMEHPDTFEKEIVVGSLRELRERGRFAEKSWKVFVPLMVAIRFGWLSEWFRKDDREMIELELTYMRLLLERRMYLEKIWSLY